MLDDDLFELDEDLLNATDFSQKFDGTGKTDTPSLEGSDAHVHATNCI